MRSKALLFLLFTFALLHSVFFLFHFRRGSFSIIQMIKVELMRVSVTRVLNELFVTQNSLTLAMNAVVVNEALYVNAKEGYSHYRTKASCSFE